MNSRLLLNENDAQNVTFLTLAKPRNIGSVAPELRQSSPEQRLASLRPRPHEDDCKRKRWLTHIFISVHTKTIIVYVAFSPVHTKTLVNAENDVINRTRMRYRFEPAIFASAPCYQVLRSRRILAH